jgi:uncharacterized iron-regulated protein
MMNMRKQTDVPITSSLAGMLLLAALFMLVPDHASAADKPEALLFTDHPLVGRSWDVKLARFISEKEYRQRLLDAEYILLGELHNNLAHHRHQAQVIRELSKAGRKAAVAYEMISLKQGEMLAGKTIASSDQLIDILKQTRSGWDYDTQYRMLFDATLAAGFPFIATNLDSKSLMSALMQDPIDIDASTRKVMDKAAFDELQDASLKAEIQYSHCDLLDDHMAGVMAQGQRLRDAVITSSLIAIDSPVKVLIAGLGHVRSDRGLPFYIQRNLQAPARILSVGMLEVSPDMNEPAAYSEYFSSDSLPFDVIVFTPRVDMGDPCEGLAEKLGKGARHGGESSK